MKKPKVSAAWPEAPYRDAVQDLLADRHNQEARQAIAGMLGEEGPRPVMRHCCMPEWVCRAALRIRRRLPRGHPDKKRYFYSIAGWAVCKMVEEWWDRHAAQLREDINQSRPNRVSVEYLSWSNFDHHGIAWAAGDRKCFVNEPYVAPKQLLLQSAWLEDLLWPYGYTLVLPIGAHYRERTPRLIALPLLPVPTKYDDRQCREVT